MLIRVMTTSSLLVRFAFDAYFGRKRVRISLGGIKSIWPNEKAKALADLNGHVSVSTHTCDDTMKRFLCVLLILL